jgi:hypothetical protein
VGQFCLNISAHLSIHSFFSVNNLQMDVIFISMSIDKPLVANFERELT